jgi:hypothetical protein
MHSLKYNTSDELSRFTRKSIRYVPGNTYVTFDHHILNDEFEDSESFITLSKALQNYFRQMCDCSVRVIIEDSDIEVGPGDVGNGKTFSIHLYPHSVEATAELLKKCSEEVEKVIEEGSIPETGLTFSQIEDIKSDLKTQDIWQHCDYTLRGPWLSYRSLRFFKQHRAQLKGAQNDDYKEFKDHVYFQVVVCTSLFNLHSNELDKGIPVEGTALVNDLAYKVYQAGSVSVQVIIDEILTNVSTLSSLHRFILGTKLKEDMDEHQFNTEYEVPVRKRSLYRTPHVFPSEIKVQNPRYKLSCRSVNIRGRLDGAEIAGKEERTFGDFAEFNRSSNSLVSEGAIVVHTRTGTLGLKVKLGYVELTSDDFESAVYVADTMKEETE